MKQCPTCGSLNPDDAAVCADCGMELPAHGTAVGHAATPETPTAMHEAPVATPHSDLATPHAEMAAPHVPTTPSFDFAPEASGSAASAEPTPAPAASPLPSDPFAGSQWDFDLDKGSVATPAETPASGTPTTVMESLPMTPTPAPIPVGMGATGGAAKLILKRGGALTGDVFSIGPSATVGRFDPESGPVDVDMAQLPEAVYISRHHAEINLRDGQWMVKDLGSRNGTFVKNASGFTRVTGETPVQSGDEVAFGNARFEFSLV